jgi:DNA polymerase/3'-5' exonuclease PolX
MSTTATKRPLADARRDAQELRALLDITCERWTVAGSVRRCRPVVGDVEHVVQAKTGFVSVGLFGEQRPVSLLLDRLDQLVAGGEVAKHVYSDGGVRWGERYRGVSFRGFAHELFIATPENYGPTLAIRTGPADFSKRLVTGLRMRGMRNHHGYVWECEPCRTCGRGNCPTCQGTGLVPKVQLSVQDERAYFALCGVGWREPEERA